MVDGAAADRRRARSGRMRKVVVAAALLAAGGVVAQPIECGGEYVVRPGDTLQRIAVRAYGPEANWRTLWQVNEGRLRRDPSLIEVGDRVLVPCLDPEGAPYPASVDASEPVGPIRVAFVDAPGGGPALHAVVRMALTRRIGEEEVIYEDTATLRPGDPPEAPVGAAVVAVVQPDCASDAPPARAACEDRVWSVPLREIVVSAFSRAEHGDADLTAQERLCLQIGLPAALAVDMGFTEVAAFAPPQTAAACLGALAAGETDAAVVETSAAEAETARLALGATLVEHTALARAATLRAAAKAGDAEGARAVAAIDAALADAVDAAIARAALTADALSR
ncbi:MAG: LysM peptidoglycan-binding domain-containing protein [Rhodobacteraceae bacterium]|nr:MAG: LysM peptidoglycan-binding domain-containing protein [Paracoccaceae bacterium]